MVHFETHARTHIYTYYIHAHTRIQTDLRILDPSGTSGALLSPLLENHPVDELAVVDGTT